jgi:PAS domain S-box-containing protein
LGSIGTSPVASHNRRHDRRPRLFAYLWALMMVLLAASVYGFFFPATRIPFITFYPCIFVIALLFGAGPAVLSSLMSALMANWLFMGEPYTWSITRQEISATLTFLILSVSTALLAEWQRRTQHKLRLETVERSKSELTERQLRTYLQQILKGMSDALIAVDRNGRIEMMNGPAEQLTGFTLEEARGTPVDSVYQTIDETTGKTLKPTVFEALHHGIATGLANHKILVNRDGRSFAIDDAASPIRDETGAITGAVLLFRDMEERRNAQRKLEQSERQLVGILESIGDGFVAIDKDGRLSYVNERGLEYFDPSIENPIGQVLWDLFPQYHGVDIFDRLRRAHLDRTTERIEHFSTRLHRWLEVAAFPMLDGGLSLYIRDIHDRKMAEDALREARDRLGIALRSGRMGLWTRELRPEDRVQWSPELESVFGLEPGTFQGTEEAFFNLIFEEDRDKVREAVAYAVTNRTEYEVEFRFHHAQGGVRWMSGRGRAFYDANGNPLRMAGAGIDITERKRAELALHLSEQRFRRLYESNLVGIAFFRLSGEVIEANDEFLRLLDIQRDTFNPWSRVNWLERLSEASRNSVQDGVRQLLTTGVMPVLEAEFVNAPQAGQSSRESRVPIILGAAMLDDPSYDAVAFVLDNTARKDTERRLQRVNEDLEHFTRSASHDLQEPLRVTSTYLQLLAATMTGKLSAKEQRALDFALDGAERSVALLESLRAYWQTTVATGSEEEFIDSGQAVETALAHLRQSISTSGAKIRVGPMPMLRAQAGPLTQVFQNLIGNAIKYRGSDPPCIEVSASRSGPYWVFTVDDNGVGVPAAYREQIFRPFQRLHGREVEGTGLGLSLCQKIIERYGGRIWVESRNGAGSRFAFELPASDG